MGVFEKLDTHEERVFRGLDAQLDKVEAEMKKVCKEGLTAAEPIFQAVRRQKKLAEKALGAEDRSKAAELVANALQILGLAKKATSDAKNLTKAMEFIIVLPDKKSVACFLRSFLKIPTGYSVSGWWAHTRNVLARWDRLRQNREIRELNQLQEQILELSKHQVTPMSWDEIVDMWVLLAENAENDISTQRGKQVLRVLFSPKVRELLGAGVRLRHISGPAPDGLLQMLKNLQLELRTASFPCLKSLNWEVIAIQRIQARRTRS